VRYVAAAPGQQWCGAQSCFIFSHLIFVALNLSMSLPHPSFQSAIRPFMTLPRVASFHASREAQATLDGLHRAIVRAEGIGLVIGGTGTGKSLLLACLREKLDDQFAVALLSGARICTRRGLWQSILADIGEPYRDLDEETLRIDLVDRIRGLAATGGGLVVLVDEANTLPRRLLEELRLLVSVVNARPAVHLVLAGSVRLEEMLGDPDLEGIAQRVAVRGYLEPLDYTETCQYLRTQMQAVGLDWDECFAPEADAAVFSITDGVPRLINQVCDQALRLAEQQAVAPVGNAELAAAWEQIQRLPAPPSIQAALGQSTASTTELSDESVNVLPEPPVPVIGGEASSVTDEDDHDGFAGEGSATIIEFGTLDDTDVNSEEGHHVVPEGTVGEDDTGSLRETVSFPQAESGQAVGVFGKCFPQQDAAEQDELATVGLASADGQAGYEQPIDFAASLQATEYAAQALLEAAGGVIDGGEDDEVMIRPRARASADRSGYLTDDIELIFDPPFTEEEHVSRPDPFAEIFADEEAVAERFLMNGPDDFHNRLHVSCREGEAMARQLPACDAGPVTAPEAPHEISKTEFVPEEDTAGDGRVESVMDDSDMVVIEEDIHVDPCESEQSVQPVRLGDYSRLFARLRRGGQLESSRRA
jgi:type II secretory pathway predicted ATPase ExeA